MDRSRVLPRAMYYHKSEIFMLCTSNGALAYKCQIPEFKCCQRHQNSVLARSRVPLLLKSAVPAFMPPMNYRAPCHARRTFTHFMFLSLLTAHSRPITSIISECQFFLFCLKSETCIAWAMPQGLKVIAYNIIAKTWISVGMVKVWYSFNL